MRKLKRAKLTGRTLAFLKKRTGKVSAKSSNDPKVEEAKRLWDSKNNKSFDEIKEKLQHMAPGNERCMYCEDSAGTDIEHFWPKSTYPLKAFDWDNYLLACSTCNSNYKRTQFPLDENRQPLLINPVEEEPLHHIAFSPRTGQYGHISTKGFQSIKVYGLNRSLLVLGRIDAWIHVQALIILYGIRSNAGNNESAQKIKESLCRSPYIGEFIAFLYTFDSHESHLIEAECIQTVQQYPEIKNWLS